MVLSNKLARAAAVAVSAASAVLADPAVVYVTEWDVVTVTSWVEAGVKQASTVTVNSQASAAPQSVSVHSHDGSSAGNYVQTVAIDTSAAEAAAAAATTSVVAQVETSSTPAAAVVTVETSSTPAADPTTSTAAAAQSSAASSSDSDLTDYEKELIDYHNWARSQHSAPPVEWNATLASFAQDYLNNGNCVFQHSGGPYGENIALGYSSSTAACEAWYNEYADYDYASGQFTEGTGHFTQMVWEATTQLGCATVDCDGSQFLACEYYPRGNIIGYFTQNVLAS